MRVLFLGDVEHQPPLAVDGFQVRFDTGCLVGLFLFVGLDGKPHVMLLAFVGEQRAEHLPEERVLQGVVFHVMIEGRLPSDIFVQEKIPVDKLGVQPTVQEPFDHVIHPLQLADQPHRLGGTFLRLVLTRSRVAVSHQEFEFRERRHLSPGQFLEHFALADGVVEVFGLLGGSADF